MNLIPCIKMHVNNKLTHYVATRQIIKTYPIESAQHFGMDKIPAERSLYRALERVYPGVIIPRKVSANKWRN